MREQHRHLPHVVYRCYSHVGVLLYVGASHDLKARLAQHRGDYTRSDHRYPAWFPLVARVTFEEYPDGDSAYSAEVEVIRAELPVFNVSGTGKRSPLVTPLVVEPHVPEYQPKHARAAA